MTRLAVLLPLLLLSTLCSGSYVTGGGDVLYVDVNDTPEVHWLVSHKDNEIEDSTDRGKVVRSKRSPKQPPPKYSKPVSTGQFELIKPEACRERLRRLCSVMDKEMDDLFFLECIQTFKPNEVSGLDDGCQNSIYNYIRIVTNNENIDKMTKEECGDSLDSLNCPKTAPGSYLNCLVEKREKVADLQCSDYIQRLDWVVNDFRIIIASFLPECQNDVDKFQCGRIQPYKDILQGQTLACLQQHLNKLEPVCRKQILHVTEIQADNIMSDRQLYLACSQDHIKFCPNIRPGSGHVYKCLMQHRLDRSMTRECQDQLLRREKLIASDYRVSKGLVRACKEDIKNYRCRKNVSDDKDIRLAQILLCLESAVKNGSKVTRECQVEMFDHRKILMEDYRLSPEIVNYCANDIQTFCNNLEVGGATIHCLMEYTRIRKRKARVSAVCQRALENLIKETDAGEDWRIDPVLREACQPVVDIACKDVQGGNSRIISCLMDKLGTDKMIDSCETALVQIQYFISRDYKLDPQLYRACKADAVNFCHAKNAWSPDGTQMDAERGPLVLPCLYRYAYHPQKNMTLKKECLDEIRRVMRQRAVNVDLQPEIEEVCLEDLASFCFDKTAKGEEILCLQDKFDSLNRDCKLAVGNFTEEQAERIELNPIISTACRHMMEKHCEDVIKYGKDEGDMMECLIEHKSEIDTRTDSKCKAAVEHFQLISLKNYHFTFKFKEACRPMVTRYCPDSKTKAEVISCLSEKMQKDIIRGSKHRISRECRQQLKAQLYQQKENIKFDPKLHKTCAEEIKQNCAKVEPGNSRILECLAANKPKLGEACHALLFKIRTQEFVDSSVDFALLNACHTMVRQFCRQSDGALDCLKQHKDDAMFDDKCRTFVINRMAEQNTDYRFNVALQQFCSSDIDRHCKQIILNEPKNKELEGKVIECLKIKFKESKLTIKCEHQMETILREAALNYHLNPLIVALCAEEIDKMCKKDDDNNSPGKVEECLKTQFNADNKEMKEACRIQVAEMLEEAKADINVDPLLQKACAVDVSKYCGMVPQGAGRQLKCLQNVLKNEEKLLLPDCYKMLSTRIEMFKNADKLAAPETFEELYDSVSRSPASRYFFIIAFTMVGFIFITGMCCGRVSRRTMLMKNK
ncbi:Golgi apparatus protein 1 [Nasonia vitripennis]|uniref:Golgi apparatus protein 1 n=1 Tax=Nasonia vitripennis TaxID=7425 RepID=A0A7M7H793_NASVI|nr:Golgi apparatus protein 1 [Nasonia vitripennis]XP_008202283.1 Golgi apparatus protein 1 [Nasonia vitripennis]XP_032452407.1 Golgi apparatus protein 1 [Nasonia vitripennis]